MQLTGSKAAMPRTPLEIPSLNAGQKMRFGDGNDGCFDVKAIVENARWPFVGGARDWHRGIDEEQLLATQRHGRPSSACCTTSQPEGRRKGKCGRRLWLRSSSTAVTTDKEDEACSKSPRAVSPSSRFGWPTPTQERQCPSVG